MRNQESRNDNFYVPFRGDSFENSLRKYQNKPKKVKFNAVGEHNHHQLHCTINTFSKQQRIIFYIEAREKQAIRSREKARERSLKKGKQKKQIRSRYGDNEIQMGMIESKISKQKVEQLKGIQRQAVYQKYQLKQNQQLKLNNTNDLCKSLSIQQPYSLPTIQLEQHEQLSIQDSTILEELEDTLYRTPNKECGQVDKKGNKGEYRLSFRIIDRLHKKYLNMEELLEIMIKKRPHLGAMKEQLRENLQRRFNCS